MRISDWSSDVCSSDLIGKAKTDGPVFERALRDLGTRILGHVDRHVEHGRPAGDGMPETVQIEIDRPAAELPAEGEQVQRRKIAGGIVEEHILRNGVRGMVEKQEERRGGQECVST